MKWYDDMFGFEKVGFWVLVFSLLMLGVFIYVDVI